MRPILHLFAPRINMGWRKLVFLLFFLTLCTSCHRVSRTLEPIIVTPSHPKEIFRETRGYCYIPQDFSCSPFLPLTEEEALTDWGKEYLIALNFAADFDLYRAITSFKRALFLLPQNGARSEEIHYAVALAYYLGKKYTEVVFTVRSTPLACVVETFPAYKDLLLILYDSYLQLGEQEAAYQILQKLQILAPDIAHQLTLLKALQGANFSTLYEEAETCPNHAYLSNIVNGYMAQAKSIKKAEVLNAILPGAGYLYVGQKSSAVTSFLLNALFLGAAYHFFDSGNIAAGVITLSFESGWYFGGIYGAGLAAKSFNERLYCQFVDKITKRETLFPLFMLKYSF